MNKLFNLENKNILITGGTSEISVSLTKLLLELGANVILLSRNYEKLSDIKNTLNDNKLDIFKFDADEDVVDQLQPVLKKYNTIYGFVNNIGIDIKKTHNLINKSDFEKIANVNIFVGIEIVKLISKKQYISEDGASYIFMSSIRSILTDAALLLYSLSKAAVNMAVKSLAVELASKKIRVNAILPSFIEDTTMYNDYSSLVNEKQKEYIINKHMLGLLKPLDVAYTCVFLLSQMSNKMTGGNIILDSGYSLK